MGNIIDAIFGQKTVVDSLKERSASTISQLVGMAYDLEDINDQIRDEQFRIDEEIKKYQAAAAELAHQKIQNDIVARNIKKLLEE